MSGQASCTGHEDDAEPKHATVTTLHTNPWSARPILSNPRTSLAQPDETVNPDFALVYNIVPSGSTMPRPKRTKVASRAAPTRVITSNSISDDSDGLVVFSRKGRRRGSTERRTDAYLEGTMTGALPPPQHEEASAEKEQAEVPAPISQRNRRSLRPSVPSPTASSKSSKKLDTSKTTPRPAHVRNSPMRDETSALPVQDAHISDEESSLLDPSLLTFGSLDSDSPAHGTRPPSAIKVGATPAHETSILALTNFKRRARQPSLLRMVHQTTDVEDNDYDLEDLDDFDPDDESTPIQNRKKKVAHGTSDSSPPSAGSRGTKRKLSSPVIQVPRSSPPYDPPSGADVARSERSSSLSLPEATVENVENVESREQEDPEVWSETMAPPRSSSSVEENEEPEADLQQPKSRTATRTRRGKTASKKGAPAISTAKLQELLPRRRRRAPQERNEYDFEGSDDVDVSPIDSDEDELQMPQRRVLKAAKPATKSRKKTSRAAQAPGLGKGAVKKKTQTYTRRTSSDKENTTGLEAEDDSVAAVEPTETSFDIPPSKLSAIAKKFEDVDAFEMQFESVDVGGGESSPWR